jgi:hypothetical protein
LEQQSHLFFFHFFSVLGPFLFFWFLFLSDLFASLIFFLVSGFFLLGREAAATVVIDVAESNNPSCGNLQEICELLQFLIFIDEKLSTG